MRAAVVLAVTAIVSQTINPSPLSLIKQTRPLLPAEVTQVLAASRHALDGQRFRLAYVAGGPGIDIIAGPNGWPHWKRATHGVDSMSSGGGSSNGVAWSQPATSEHVDLITIVEYTDQAARSCAGKPLDGNLIIEYERKTPPGTWTVTARIRSAAEELSPIFDTLADESLSSGEVRAINGRTARAFLAPYKFPASSGVITFSAPPPPMTKTLWLDVDTLLPVRWGVSVPAQPNAPALPDYGLTFTYDASIDIRAPEGVAAPTCVK
ncbi:MAG TPA: hypothetical protein VFA59_00260 [Vicinamibacterales bacterium]|nr:hypothetical protein [Vicinamibacterales bacterium]